MNSNNHAELTIDAEHLIDEDPEMVEKEASDEHQEQLRLRINLTRLLRWCGSFVLIASALAFMYQGMYSFSPMTRHWIMLVLCGSLGIIGLLTGTTLKEDKGARLFLGFAAASFPVLASQLGAMFFSIFGKPPIGMPQPLVYTLANLSMVFAITVLTLTIIVPVSYFAFRVLARSQASLLTIVYTLANLSILIPLRDDFWVSGIVITAACAILFVDILRLGKDFRLDNFEGRTARILLVTPLLVMLGRSFFYATDSSYYGFMLFLASSCLAFHWSRSIQRSGIKIISQLAGQIGMVIGWTMCLLPILNAASIGDGMATYFFILPISIMLGIQSLQCNGKTARNYRYAAVFACLISVIVAHWFQHTPMISSIAIVVAIFILALGTLTAEKLIIYCGTLIAIIGLANFGLQLFQMQISYGWLALAVIGIGAMFSASLIETERSWRFLQRPSFWGKLKKQIN